MLEKVYLYLKEENKNFDLEKRKESVELARREGWMMVSDKTDILKFLKLAEKQKNTLVITNDDSVLSPLKQAKLPVVFWCDSLKEISVYGVDMIIEELKDADRQFLMFLYKRHYGIPITIAVTKRLLIRESKEEDLEDFYRIYEEERGSGFIPAFHRDKDIEREALNAYIKNRYGFYGYGLWSVCSIDDGRVTGRVGFENFVYQGEPVAELGIVIEKTSRGLGIAREAGEAVLLYGRERLGFSEVYMRVDKRNIRSVNLANRLGFSLAESGEVLVYRKSVFL